MKLVRVPGRDLSYPGICACCVAKATTTLQVRKEDLASLAKAGLLVAAGSSTAGLLRDNRRLTIPYCQPCRNHVQWKRSGGWLGVVLHVPVNGFFGLLLGFILATIVSFAFGSGDLDHPNWFIVGGAVAIGAGLGLATLRWRPKAPIVRPHAREGDAAEIARFSDTELVLRCHNDVFAAKLIEANPGATLSRSA